MSALTEKRLPHRSDNDIRASAMLGDVLASGMEQRNRRVGMLVLLQENRRHRLATILPRPRMTTSAPLNGTPVRMSNSWTPAGRARLEEWVLAEQQLANIDRMKAVDVLAVIDCTENLGLIDVLWQRGLHENTMDLGSALSLPINSNNSACEVDSARTMVSD